MQVINIAEEFHWDFPPPDAVGVTEAANACRISPEKLTEIALKGWVPHWQAPDGNPLFVLEELEEWVKENLARRIPGKALSSPQEPEKEEEAPTECPPRFTQDEDWTSMTCGNLLVTNLKSIEKSDCGAGIYFLTKQIGDNNPFVQYIGQSLNPKQRLYGHRGKDFDNAWFMPVDERYLDEMEGALIRYWRPPLNKTHQNGEFVAPKGTGRDADIIALLGLTLSLPE